MTTLDFLLELQRLDVKVWLEGDRVRCSAPPGVLSEERRRELALRRPEIETLLRAAARAALPCAVVPIETRGTRLPLFGVPGHNGDVFCFVRLARRLGPEQPFYGLQPPGLDRDAPPLTRIEELAEYFVAAVLAQQPSGPYQIGGYCLGGLTAFEMARQLRAKGHAVAAVVLFGTSAPTSLRPLNWARAVAANWVSNRLDGARGFAEASWSERLGGLKRRAGGLTAVLAGDAAKPDELAARRARVEEATVSAARRYRPERYQGRIAMLVPNEEAIRSADRPLDWRMYADEVELFFGPGSCDGDSMLKEPEVTAFAQHLSAYLREAPSSVAASA